MLIELLDSTFDGDNNTKRLRITVDELWREMTTYLYLLPVEGDEVYCSEALTLDAEGQAVYNIPGDVTNGTGFFTAQIVCIDNNDIAKSAVYVYACSESIDDNSAVLPTGVVVTLAQIKEQLDNLTASDVAYDDTYNIGADTIQAAIDALIDGGGYVLPPATDETLGGIKVGKNLSIEEDGTLSAEAAIYVLDYLTTPVAGGELNPAEVAANTAIINEIAALEQNSYFLYIKYGTKYMPAQRIAKGVAKAFYAVDLSDEDFITVYAIGLRRTTYSQDTHIYPEATFDPTSPGFAAMDATAQYIAEQIAESGGSGTIYTAGDGITIKNNVISVSYPNGDNIAYGGSDGGSEQ